MADPVFTLTSINPFGLSGVGYAAKPIFVDIDGDGDLDAFVGNQAGNTLFFRNTGTASSPAFAAASTNLFGLSDVGTRARPTFVDIDGDGDLDAFVGNYNGNTLFFRNTGAASSPVFAAAITNPFGLSKVGSVATPTLVDIDSDGDLDAFVGNWVGNMLFFRNTGTTSSPAFAAAVTNPFGLSDVGNFASPTFVDMDGDGDLDALIGNSDGNTLFFRNTGTASNPVFVAAVTNPFGLSDVGAYASPTLVDIDGDGDLDVFVGDFNGNTAFFINNINGNQAPTATNLSATETYTEDIALDLTDIVISDIDSADITAILTLSDSAAGSLNAATSGTVTSVYNVGTGIWTASGALADVNALLAGVTFTPALNFNGNFTVSTSISDGVAAAITGSKSFTGLAVNDAPVGSVTITGAAAQGQTLNASDNLTDADGMGTVTYHWLADAADTGVTGSSYLLTQADVGKVFTVQATYTDLGGQAESVTSSATAAVANVNNAPALIAPLVDQAIQYDTLGWNYDASASFSDEDISDSLSYSATLANGDSLPAWIQIGAITGLMTGSPGFADRGTYALNITATDTQGASVSAPLTVAVTVFNAGQLLVSTAGNDILAGSLSNDTVTYAYATAPVTVSLAISSQQNTVGAGLDTLINIDNLMGGDYNDSLTGNAKSNVLDGGAGNDILNGRAGADTLIGGLGNDSYVVDNVGDVVIEYLNEGTDTVNSRVTYTLVNNVENLTLTGTLAINGTGNALANKLIGNAADNQLDGGDGNDKLHGGAGADILIGGLGDDNYDIDNVGDIIIENLNSGTEKVYCNVTYTLPANVENLTLEGILDINGTGNDLANNIIGNVADNQLDGGAGNDTLNGGAGTNSLTGGAGNDIFKFSTIDHIDTITDFVVVDDTIQLERAVFTALTTTGTLAADQFRIGTEALDPNDFIVYNNVTGVLLYDADGSGVGAAIQIVMVGVGLSMTNADIVVI